MNDNDHYKVLGIDRSATPNDIKAAYYKLAMKYHPDRNQNNLSAEEQFKKITKAYNVLKDKQLRSEYDRFLDRINHRPFDNNTGQSLGMYWFLQLIVFIATLMMFILAQSMLRFILYVIDFTINYTIQFVLNFGKQHGFSALLIYLALVIICEALLLLIIWRIKSLRKKLNNNPLKIITISLFGMIVVCDHYVTTRQSTQLKPAPYYQHIHIPRCLPSLKSSFLLPSLKK